MSERKSKNRIYLVVILRIIFSVGLFTLLSGQNFKVKNGPIIAVEYNEDIKSDNVNTVIFNGNYSKDLIKSLAKKKIQSIIAIDNVDLPKITEIVKEYEPAGILVNYCAGVDYSQLAKVKNKQKYMMLNNVSDIDSVKDFGVFDGYICKTAELSQLLDLPSDRNYKVILHYDDTKMEQNIFLLSNFSSCDGALLSENRNAAYLFDKIDDLPLFNFNVDNEFKVTYPTKDFFTYYAGTFITGTGEKSGKVYVNGDEYTAQYDGTFGVYYELDEGDNQITISQNGQNYIFNIERKVYTNTGSKNSNTTLPWDDSVELEPGRVVVTDGENIVSLLADKDDDSSIIAGIDSGVPIVVHGSEETVRNGKKTYAYRLQTGVYVLSSKVKITDYVSDIFQKDEEDDTEYLNYIQPQITEITVEALGNDEILHFKTTNKPIVTSKFISGNLSLNLLETNTELNEMPSSSFTPYAYISSDEYGTHITMDNCQGKAIWGYDVQVKDNEVLVYLKAKPTIDFDENKLKGITVMLDPGHGGYDSGAVGVASENGPVEKDLNLATAQALKAILQRNGATVIMTRDDDTFYSLEERRNMADELKPDIFMAVHHNSMDYSYNSNKAKGCECYYFTENSKFLAQNLCNEISAATGRYNRGAKQDYYYVTRTDICPAVLMEYSYLINPEEYAHTYSDLDIYTSAFASFNAILKTLEN